MSNKRFEYYTGYEVDNEPSDDDERVDLPTKALTAGDVDSDSSGDEFDRPLHEYIQKNEASFGGEKRSLSKKTTSDTFADEMEDELDQIYNNFISRGTFDLPISTDQKSSIAKGTDIRNNEENSESDDDSNPTVRVQDDQEKTNDDLLYDPEEEEEDEKWMNKQRIKSQGHHIGENLDKVTLGPTDAVLNCPACMVLICHDCQRHDTIKNQYRAMFVFNCTIDENRIALPAGNTESKSVKKKKSQAAKRFKYDDKNSVTTANGDDVESSQDILRPVLCSECGTEVGVYEPKEELYHFANVLASH